MNLWMLKKDLGLRPHLPVVDMFLTVLNKSGGGGDTRHTQTHNPPPFASSHNKAEQSVTES